MDLTTEIAHFINPDNKEFKNYDEMVDHLEGALVDHFPLIELPLAHRVSPGLYTRQMVAPKDTLLISKVHNTEHQFIVSQGSLLVFNESTNVWDKITAPHHGITPKGTRRIAVVLEDLVWTTMHSTDLVEDKEYSEEEFIKLIEDIENKIIDKREPIVKHLK